MYISFPEMIEGQDAWCIGERIITKDECEELKQQLRGYERTVNRLQASKLRKRIKELTDAS